LVLKAELNDGVGHAKSVFQMGAVIDLVKRIAVFVKSYYATYLKYIQSSQGSNLA
jgi:hypothetical protein